MRTMVAEVRSLGGLCRRVVADGLKFLLLIPPALVWSGIFMHLAGTWPRASLMEIAWGVTWVLMQVVGGQSCSG